MRLLIMIGLALTLATGAQATDSVRYKTGCGVGAGVGLTRPTSEGRTLEDASAHWAARLMCDAILEEQYMIGAMLQYNRSNLGGEIGYANSYDIGLRFGLLPTDRLLIYVGLGLTRLDAGNDLDGWKAQLGVEYLLNPNVSVWVEGAHADYGSDTLRSRFKGGFSTKGPEVDSIMVGLTYRY